MFREKILVRFGAGVLGPPLGEEATPAQQICHNVGTGEPTNNNIPFSDGKGCCDARGVAEFKRHSHTLQDLLGEKPLVPHNYGPGQNISI